MSWHARSLVPAYNIDQYPVHKHSTDFQYQYTGRQYRSRVPGYTTSVPLPGISINVSTGSPSRGVGC
eukprot:726615-Rhodomonas_salina.2